MRAVRTVAAQQNHLGSLLVAEAEDFGQRKPGRLDFALGACPVPAAKVHADTGGAVPVAELVDAGAGAGNAAVAGAVRALHQMDREHCSGGSQAAPNVPVVDASREEMDSFVAMRGRTAWTEVASAVQAPCSFSSEQDVWKQYPFPMSDPFRRHSVVPPQDHPEAAAVVVVVVHGHVSSCDCSWLLVHVHHRRILVLPPAPLHHGNYWHPSPSSRGAMR